MADSMADDSMQDSNPWCKTCGEYKSSYSTHKCPPTWECWEDEDSELGWADDDAENPAVVHAQDAEIAAEKFIAEAESAAAEYPVASCRSTATVCVRGQDGNVTKWVVEGDPSPQYYVRAKA